METITESPSSETQPSKTSPSEQLLVIIFRALRVLASALTSHGVSPQMSVFAARFLAFLLLLFLPLIVALFGLAIMLLSLAVCFSFAMVVSSICAFWWILVFAIFLAVSFAIFACSVIMLVTPFLVPVFGLCACGWLAVVQFVRMLANSGYGQFQRLDSAIATTLDRFKQETSVGIVSQNTQIQQTPPKHENQNKPQPVDQPQQSDAAIFVDAVTVSDKDSDA